MRFFLMLFCLSFWNYCFSSDSTIIKYKNVLEQDMLEQINRVKSSDERIIKLAYNEKPAMDAGERVLGLYRRASDKDIWDFTKMDVLNTYLQKFKDSSDVDFYIVLASVYKYYNVGDDPNNIYEYQQLNAQKKKRQQEIKELQLAENLEVDREGISKNNSKKFLSFAAKVSQTYNSVFQSNANGRRVFALIVISSFYPNSKDGSVGKVLHSFGVAHDKFNYSGYEFEEFFGFFLGNRTEFNQGVFNKEEKLGEYVRLMYQIKKGQVIPESGTYKRLGNGIPKSKIKSDSYLHEFQGKVGKQHKPQTVPPTDPNPNVYDHTGALTPFEINDALQKFQRVKTERGYILKVFTTDYATPYNELRIIDEYVKNPAANDMILWVHFNKTKDPEFNFYYGSNIPNKDELNFLETFIVDIFGGTAISFNPFTAILDGLSSMIGWFKINPRYYDPEHAEFNPVPSDIYKLVTLGAGMPGVSTALKVLPAFPYLNAPYTPIRAEFALYCGAWNGVIDILAGIPEFASFLIKMVSEEEQRDEFLSGWNKMKEKGILKSIKEGFVAAHTGNACVVAAQIGHDIIDVLSVVIAFSKAGNAAKISAFLDAVDPSSYVVRYLTKALVQIPTIVIQGLDYSKNFVFKLANTFYRLHDINGKPLLQVALQNVNSFFQSINWSNYTPAIQLVGPDGKNYTVLMSADPAANLLNGETITRIIDDGSGTSLGGTKTPFHDAEGNGLAELSNGKVVPVKDVLQSSGKLTDLINTLGSKFPQLKIKLETILPSDPAFVQAFFDDFGEADVLLESFNKTITESDALSLDAWEAFYKAGRSELRKDASKLKKLTDLLQSNNFGPNGSLWGKAEFENLFKKHADYGRGGKELVDEDGVTQTIVNATLPAGDLLDILDMARRFPKPGMEKVLDKLCCSNGTFYIGAEWQLRYARDIWDNVASFESKIPPNATSDFREVDILLKNGDI